jgi:two-component system NtrC family sensor kinase
MNGFGAMSKILVIDDEDSIRRLLALSLSHKGYEVVVSEDGEKGIAAFEETRPPIVLTDIKMPGMDGIEVLRSIKQLNPDTEVIVITGHGEMESAIRSLQLEASDFINKPIRDEALAIALKRAEDRLWMRQKLRDYTSNLESMVRDATEDLRKASDFQENLIRSSVDAIIATEKGGAIVVFNQAAEDLLGYTADEVIGQVDMSAIYLPGLAEMIAETLAADSYGGKGRLVNYENFAVSKNGESIPVRISGATLFENGGPAGVVYFFQDLREIKRLQRELIENERLSAMGQAIAGMAHYIKNILNGLQGGVYMVNTGLKKSKSSLLPKGWEMVQNNIGKISELVMNMLIYSKEREPDYVNCSPNEIAQQVYELMHEKARQSKVKLIKDFDLSISECYLDPNGLHRCLLNLVSNAIDACTLDPRQDRVWSVEIKTRREKDGIRLDVVDSGKGMTKEVQEKLFQRFFTTKGGKGTGFGLLVTRKIVEEHGGTVCFKSSPGKGTTFTIRLPHRCSEDAKDTISMAERGAQ